MQKLGALAIVLVAMGPMTGCGNTGALTAIVSCEVGGYTPRRAGDKLTPDTASDMEKNNESRRSAGCPMPESLRTKKS
jgi:hypothetical protein